MAVVKADAYGHGMAEAARRMTALFFSTNMD